MATVAAARGRSNSVAPSAYPDARREPGRLEGIISAPEVTPERRPRAALAVRKVLLRHAERVNLHLEALLAAAQGCCHQTPDLVHDGIRHGEAADRRAPTVHHDEG